MRPKTIADALTMAIVLLTVLGAGIVIVARVNTGFSDRRLTSALIVFGIALVTSGVLSAWYVRLHATAEGKAFSVFATFGLVFASLAMATTIGLLQYFIVQTGLSSGKTIDHHNAAVANSSPVAVGNGASVEQGGNNAVVKRQLQMPAEAGRLRETATSKPTGSGMLELAMGFMASFTFVLFIVRFSGRYGALSLDHDLRGIQKNHAYAVPRIGGAGIACAVAITLIVQPLWTSNTGTSSLLLLMCATPVFAGGIIEDMTKRVTPKAQLLCALVSALAACLVMHATLTRVDLPLVDQLLSIVPIGIAFTMFSVAGVTSAVNIIDGLNGLASVTAILIFASIGYVAHNVNDYFVMNIALTMIGAIGGFVIWNFPAATIFLGDCGAYFVGFMMAELLVLLIVRNPGVSAWYAMGVAVYPVVETLFSIYRRGFVRARPVDQADGLHLHTLLYRRVVRKGLDPRQRSLRNSYASVYLWILSLVGIAPATFFWETPVVLAAAIVAFIMVYVWLYVAIVHFRSPRWLMMTSDSPVASRREAERRR